MYGLYLHIPFCVRKCLYCDFYSLPMGHGPLSKRVKAAETHDASVFLDALEVELGRLPKPYRPGTIFIGGGTPTELSDRDFQRLFKLIRQHIDLTALEEWTCESNPGTLTREKARIMKDHGVNRVSLGVQSFNPAALEFLGRIHSADEARDGYELLRTEGFANINLDLMYGIPGSDKHVVDADLTELIRLQPDHASCYCLIFEDGTPLAELRNKGYVKEVEDEPELEQYTLVRTRLADAGYGQYENSNFALPGRECRHNLLYWGAGEYQGCGPSAHSHWQGQRFGNVRKLEAYCKALLEGGEVRAFTESLPPEAKARETLVMALRRTRGINRAEFKAWTGYDYRDLCGDTIDWLCQTGLLQETGDRIHLTEQGLFVSDGVFAELV